MSELTKNNFNRSGFNRSEAFRVEENDKGEWRAAPKPATVPEPKVEKEEKVKKEKVKKEKVKKEKVKKPHPKLKMVLKIFSYILLAIQLATSVLFVISLASMHILAIYWVILIAALLLVLFIFNLYKLVISKKASTAMRITCGVFSVIAIAATIFAFRYTGAFNNFLSKITENRKETKEYSVLVLEKSELNELEDVKDKNLGFLKTDERATNAEQYLQEKVSFNSSYYSDLDTLAGVLDSKLVDAIVLETSRIEMLKEDAKDTIKNTRVIYTFVIEFEPENVEVSNKQITEEPFILYISGTDSRHGLKATARSDVNILAVVNPKKGKILLVSIPRDTYVYLHGVTEIKDKLTHAGVYGINMSKATVEDFLGIKIDYTAKVSFDTVTGLVDQIDGIEIDSDQEMKLKVLNKDKTCKYTVGKQHVDGDCALTFARERKSYKSGDKHRGENQQQVITKIIEKLSKSKSYLIKIPEILDAIADSFETSLTRDNISDFIRMQLDNGTNWEVKSIAIDGTGSHQGTYSMGVNRPLYVMIPDEASVEKATTRIQEYLQTEED